MKLFPANATDFTNLGYGILSEVTQAKVNEDRNGEYELTFKYPMTGRLYDLLEVRLIVTAKHNPYDDEQPFRIYKISRPINGIVTVNCHHVSYDLSFIPISPFTAPNIYEVFRILNGETTDPQGNPYIETPCPFTFDTDKSEDWVNTQRLRNTTPSSVRSLLAGRVGSIIDTYGGEWQFDGWHCSLMTARGSDNGVTIEYGKNLTKMTDNTVIESTASGVYPYWKGDDGELIVLPEKIIYAEGVEHTTVRAIDFTDKFEDKPTVEELRTRCVKFIKDNDLANPYHSLSVDFITLDMTDEYRQLGLQEQIMLCDWITVTFPRLGVTRKAKIVGTEYDVILDRYTNIDVGQARTSIADTIAEQARQIEMPLGQSATMAAIHNATSQITGNYGGYVVLHDVNGDGKPDELLILGDNEDYTLANKVWRWNSAGLGYSSTGYNGEFGLAMTADGEIVADYIKTGVLNGDLIQAGHVNAQYITVNNYDDEEQRELSSYFSVGTEDGVVTLTLGDRTQGSGMILKLTGNKVAFCNAQGYELAYWTNNEFILTDLTSQMRIGATLIRPQGNGSLSFVAAT